MSTHRFTAEFYRLDGASLGDLELQVDWAPAIEGAKLEVLRRKLASPAELLPSSRFNIDPVWDPTRGEPFVSACCVRTEVDGCTFSFNVGAEYFKQAAQTGSAEFLRRGLLSEGEEFSYRVCAYPATPAVDDVRNLAFAMEEPPHQLMLTNASLNEELEFAETIGIQQVDDMSIVVAGRLLAEIRSCVEMAGPLETGGVLLGELCRDTDHQQNLFLKITEQIQRREGKASSTQCAFTDDTWAEAMSVLKLRGRTRELIVGWWHSHPARYWCLECPIERRRVCPLQARPGWLSSQDLAMHRVVFSRAYSCALLASHREAGVEFDMFSARAGLIVHRGFHVAKPEIMNRYSLNESPSVGGTTSHAAI
jgi:hypothetical protein